MMTMKVPNKAELIHLKIQAAMREKNFPEDEIKYLGERDGTPWYLVAGKYEVPVDDILEFEGT